MNDILKKENPFQSKKGWSAIVSIVMLISGCACFILSCVAAMIITNKTS